MTAPLRKRTRTLNLGRRDHDEVWTPRPCGGDHKKLVRASLADTVSKHEKALKELAKV